MYNSNPKGLNTLFLLLSVACITTGLGGFLTTLWFMDNMFLGLKIFMSAFFSWCVIAMISFLVKRLLEATPSSPLTGTTATSSWISVEERLPEYPEHDWVLVQIKLIPEGWYGVPHIAELRRGVWFSSSCDGPLEETCGVKVTHWQELPAKPEL